MYNVCRKWISSEAFLNNKCYFYVVQQRNGIHQIWFQTLKIFWNGFISPTNPSSTHKTHLVSNQSPPSLHMYRLLPSIWGGGPTPSFTLPSPPRPCIYISSLICVCVLYWAFLNSSQYNQIHIPYIMEGGGGYLFPPQKKNILPQSLI